LQYCAVIDTSQPLGSPHPAPADSSATAGPGRRRVVAALLLALVLAMHAVLLGVAPVGFGGRSESVPRPVLQTRQIVLATPTVVAEVPPAPTSPLNPLAPPTPVEAPRPQPAPAAAPEPAPAASAPLEPPPAPVAAERPAAVSAAVSAVLSAEEAASVPSRPRAETSAEAPGAKAGEALGVAAASTGEPVPVYATRLPPPARLDYELRRGLLGGSGALVWQLTPDGYQMSLEGQAFGLSVLAWASRGAIDANGIAPVRFTDRRRNRSEQAANFRRKDGFISYSGPPVEVPLPPGAQDRLSWMVQLPAILEANPALREPGQRIVLFVTGARGDADLWTFVVQGRESLSLPAGPVPDAIHLLRAPRKAYDTRAEAWLDPARGHLPVRARIGSAEGGDSTELLLAP
jgi:hypothetical protein